MEKIERLVKIKETLNYVLIKITFNEKNKIKIKTCNYWKNSGKVTYFDSGDNLETSLWGSIEAFVESGDETFDVF